MTEHSAEPVAHCLHCGHVLRAEAKFCSACGAPADAAGWEAPPREAHAARGQARFHLHLAEIKRIAWLFGLLLLTSLLFGTLAARDTTPWSDVVASLADAVIVFVFAGARFREIRPLLGLPRADRRRAALLLLLSLAFLALMWSYFALIEKAGVHMLHMTTQYQDAEWGIALTLLFTSIMPAVVEETAFRGVIQSVLERVLGPREALFIQAALFSVLHLLPMMFPSHFVMGLVFGYLRMQTRSLYPGMALHATWNALVVLDEFYG